SGLTEDDGFGCDRPCRAAWGAVLLPVEVRVRDDSLGWGSAPLALVVGGVRILDERRVVAAHDRAVQRRPDAGVRLCTCDDESTDPACCERRFEVGVFEGVAVALVDQGLGLL